MGNGKFYRRMIGVVRLKNDCPGPLSPARSPGHLRQDLKCSFSRAKVGNPEHVIGGENADQRNPRQIMSLGHHLGPDENVHFSGLKLSVKVKKLRFAAGVITVHDENPGIGKDALYLFLHLLGPETLAYVFGAAVDAGIFEFLPDSAVMALD